MPLYEHKTGEREDVIEGGHEHLRLSGTDGWRRIDQATTQPAKDEKPEPKKVP